MTIFGLKGPELNRDTSNATRGLFYASHLVAISGKDVNIDEDAMHIRLSRSKGDPKRRGTLIGIPRGVTRNCPVRAYEKWLKAADLNTGAVFRRVWSPPKNKMASSPTLRRPKIGPSPLSDRAIADIIQKWCGVTGLEEIFQGIVFGAAQSVPAPKTDMTFWN